MGTKAPCMGTKAHCMGTKAHCMGTKAHCMGTMAHCMHSLVASVIGKHKHKVHKVSVLSEQSPAQ